MELLQENIILLNAERKLRRKAEKKKNRKDLDVKRMPKIFLVCDIKSTQWMLSQCDPNKSLLVIDEAPMGSDVVPNSPMDNRIPNAN